MQKYPITDTNLKRICEFMQLGPQTRQKETFWTQWCGNLDSTPTTKDFMELAGEFSTLLEETVACTNKIEQSIDLIQQDMLLNSYIEEENASVPDMQKSIIEISQNIENMARLILEDPMTENL